jgi:branched-chain amino acid transport system permease protein
MNFTAILVDGLRAAINPQALAYMLAAMGLNVHFGYTGLLNFGQAAFMSVGVFGLAITVTRLGGSLWLGLLVGILASVVLALLLGLPTLRLRSDYLAITTIAASEILRLLLRSGPLEPVTGGVFGIQQFANDFYALNPYPAGRRYGIGPLTFASNEFWVMTVGWLLVLLVGLIIYIVMNSPWGRVLKSIREDEEAARSLGKNTYLYKMQSLIFGGVLGALGGALLGIYQQQANPDAFQPIVTFYAYIALILGGPARAFAPIFGALGFWFVVASLDTALREAIGAGYISPAILDANEIGIVRFALVGLGLILLMVFRPQGLFGNKEEIALDPT